MKFRCERDTLAEAIGTAQRAVASERCASGALGLSGPARGRRPWSSSAPTSSSPSASRPGPGREPGEAVVPAKLFGDIVRQLEPGTVTVEVEGDDARIAAGSVRDRRCGRCRPTTSPPAASPSGGVTVEARRRSRRHCARWCRRRRRTTPGRSSPACCSRPHAGGLRLVATDSYRLAVRDLDGREHARRGPEGARRPRKGLAEVQRLARRRRDRGGARRARGRVPRPGPAEVTTRLIEGDFPNYEQLIPAGYPNRLTVARDALEAAVDRVQLVGQSRDNAPVRLRMIARRARALGDRPGRRRRARGARREVRGHRAHRGVQPAVPARRHRRGRAATRSCSRRSTR